MVFRDGNGIMELPAPRLVGRHQLDNAGTAIATLRCIHALRIPDTAIEQGLTSVEWPARMQRLARGRLVELAPEGAEL
ncbi:hypothetical protein RSW14_25745, partial [Escherichia coli]|nr:hypothetical protein [Escherichia coli]